MTRTFYFLRDVVSGKFYSGSIILEDFDKAAVYNRRENAEKKVKDLEESWKTLLRYCDQARKEGYAYDNIEKNIEDLETRQKLPHWGIEIVQGEVRLNDVE